KLCACSALVMTKVGSKAISQAYAMPNPIRRGDSYRASGLAVTPAEKRGIVLRSDGGHYRRDGSAFVNDGPLDRCPGPVAIARCLQRAFCERPMVIVDKSGPLAKLAVKDEWRNMKCPQDGI